MDPLAKYGFEEAFRQAPIDELRELLSLLRAELRRRKRAEVTA